MGYVQSEGDDVGNALMAIQIGEYQLTLKRQAVKIQKSEATTRETKTKSNIREVYKWSGKEAMLAKSMVIIRIPTVQATKVQIRATYERCVIGTEEVIYLTL